MMIRMFVFAILAAGCAPAADFAVVANQSVKASAVSAEELRQVFLGSKSSLDDGSPVEPVLAQSGPTHEAFLKSCVGKSDAALRNHLKTLVFTGKGSMPKSFASDADIVSYVAKTKGAIGYVASSAAAVAVKKLELKP
jgi:ABC-type phosphate transport system substrate-binding protein